MENTSKPAFLGTGWSFPPYFDQQQRQVQMVSDVEDIQESLMILLTTQLGERVMNPAYGAGMERLSFESLSTNLKTEMTAIVKNAALRFEPRIDVDSVEMDDSGELEGRIVITLNFTVRATNSRANLVFPYYKNEGTNL